MSEHFHEHGEAFGCEHEHHHDEECSCGCGHDHHHHHEHHEECGCGCEHEHGHEHAHHEEEKKPGVVYTQVRLHDDAKVVSGSLLISGNYEKIRTGLHRGLTEFAAAVAEKGGVIGHIKASAEVTQTEMFSVTEADVMIKTAPDCRVAVILAAIVFFISEEEAELLARKALAAAIPE